MLNLLVTFTYSAENRAEVHRLLAELSSESRKEKGNYCYQYYLHPTDPLQVLLTKKWENQDVLDAHEKTPHFEAIFPQLQALTNDIKIEKF